MSEIKTPQAGEWWGDDSGPAFYMIGRNSHGEMVYEVRSGKRSYIERDITNYWADAVHLPDCTGWDWKEPDWAPLSQEEYGWHVLRAGVDQCKYKNDTNWQLVDALAGRQIGHRWYCCDYTFRCLRKDLPIKPPAKPDLGEGFRLLEPDEKVIKGDEYWEPKGTPRWEKSDNWRYRNGEQSSELVYRRRKEKPSSVVSLDTYEKVVAERNALQDRLREIEAKAKCYEWKF